MIRIRYILPFFMIITSTTYSRVPYQNLRHNVKKVEKVVKKVKAKNVFENSGEELKKEVRLVRKKIERLINGEKAGRFVASVVSLKQITTPDQLNQVLATMLDRKNLKKLIAGSNFSTKKNEPLSTKHLLCLLRDHPKQFFKTIGNPYAKTLAAYIHEKRRINKN